MSETETIRRFVDHITAKFGKKSLPIKQFKKRFDAKPDTYTHFFVEFYRDNRVAIETRNIGEISVSSNEESPFNSIDVRSLLENSKVKDVDLLWGHLDNIGRLFHSTKQPQQQLPSASESKSDKTNTTPPDPQQFVNDMLKKVSEHIPKDETNPMDAFMSLMKSDKLGELMDMVTTNIRNNNIDLGALLSATQNQQSGTNGRPENKNNKNNNNNKMNRPRSDLLSPRPRISSPPSPSMPPLAPSSPRSDSPVRCLHNEDPE